MHVVFINTLTVTHEVNLEVGQIIELHDELPMFCSTVSDWLVALNRSACGYSLGLKEVPDEDLIALVRVTSKKEMPIELVDQKRLTVSEILVEKLGKMTPQFKTVTGELDEEGKVIPPYEMAIEPIFEKTSQAYKDKLVIKPAPPEDPEPINPEIKK